MRPFLAAAQGLVFVGSISTAAPSSPTVPASPPDAGTANAGAATSVPAVVCATGDQCLASGRALVSIMNSRCAGGAGQPMRCGPLPLPFIEGSDDAMAKALGYFEAGCQLDNVEACTLAGAMIVSSDDKTPAANGRALSYFDKACTKLGGRPCWAAGLLLYKGETVTKDLVRARALFGRSCATYPDSCRNAAWMLMNGEGGPVDEPGALARFLTSCKDGDVDSCLTAGKLLRDGAGGAPNPQLATQLFAKVCQAGVPSGCTFTYFMYSNGESLPPDGKKARAYLEKACKLDEELCAMKILLDFNLEKGRKTWAGRRRSAAKK